MSKPARYDLFLKRRADYVLRFQIKDELKQPVNLTGFQVQAQIWDQARQTKYADFAYSPESPTLGKGRLSLAASVTQVLPDDSWYDMLIIAPSGSKEYYLEGIVYAEEGYTSLP